LLNRRGPGAWAQLPEQMRASMGDNALTCLDEELGIEVATARVHVADSVGQGADVCDF
jgi:hypothetical protein